MCHPGQMNVLANGKAGSDLERELRQVVEGEVRFDDYSRLLYATDASMYQVEPIGVVIPRSAADVHAVLELAHRENVPVLPRGGGTSLAGQAVNHAPVHARNNQKATPCDANVLENSLMPVRKAWGVFR